MDDRTLYATILGLAEPWYVAGVAVHADREEIEVPVALRAEAALTCPECEQAAPWYDRAGFEDRDMQMVRLKGNPKWDPVRDHPRFRALLRRMKLPD